MTGMLAIQKLSPGYGQVAAALVDRPAPPEGDEVRLRVEAAGICGTDLLIYKWGAFAQRMRPPTILGHEVSGIVLETGPAVRRLRPGMRVSVESHLPCGNCYTCHRGWSHVCPHTLYPGIDFNGGFASEVLLPERVLWPVPEDVPAEAAAMMEPFGIAVHASLEGSGVSGLNVLISGCGPIGLMNVAVARALGAARVIAVDVNGYRLRSAEGMGATHMIEPGRDNLVETVRRLCGGRGVDVAIDYSANAGALDAIGEAVTPGGEIRLLGVAEGTVGVNLERWVLKGLIVRGLHGRRLFESWERSTELLRSGRVDLAPLVSHRLPLQAAEEGFALALKGEALKILFEPNG